ncbi:ATP-binding cassette domain-containing protein [Methylovirgula sp. 4M-Z18]|uniref:ATP-binding cassette domain-containing protein n=1 Tax=Methylovirgula sp. 4M-Z18 TaxID=2293567 RepID=UPI000E2E5CC9|nr:ATP-binding cassette domain-containing protein [Methylovirgula sp. 4M-Z18]RFB80061.1 ATP-binding cassette domain-containing protein [Methylovirgula sp. 4M-Z18]
MSDIAARAIVNFEAQFRERPNAGLELTLRKLGKSFADKPVLQNLDLHIPAGQFVAVIGQSGCGKSTLLRLLAGLEAPSGGHIHYGGAREARDETRMMFQEPRLLPWASVLGNVEVGRSDSPNKALTRERALQALQAVGLADRAADWPAVLSGGQKQRVAFARALVSRPRLLAFDEPFGALDALTRIEMQRLLEDLWLQQRFTAVLVTHDVSEALNLADRIILIEAGKIALDLAVTLQRPRRRGNVDLAVLEERILRRLVKEHVRRPEYSI